MFRRLCALRCAATPNSVPPIREKAKEAGKRKFRIQSGHAMETEKSYDERGQFFSAFLSLGIISLGCSFLFVPIYRLYCAPSGRGIDPKFYTPEEARKRDEENKAFPVAKKLLKVSFLSDVGNTMPIVFVPLQKEVEVLIGEPALAFFSAYNRSNRTLLGVSSYTIAPSEVTNYLNKIQCFCFEEQRFKPHELVEMPVFFYIDRDFLNDPLVNWLDEVIVNYTFFNLEKTRDIVFRAN
ncbi:cytochrome c oxidase assembly protein subunit 11 [Angomonas deanei]|uniref:Cytochrome c oxidase assembly protein CtaG/Cox11, putative n=1 Tax=Angomonas deanei TaxID=59799 RepID=S9UIN8_9TRYP|nr:cytochrome c oxidase assembly protein subunit 11 [Angomonas deanei]EPY28828.1 cytochrome c oxidase assembly protein subunit 11 [Angomonas deanei]CAD2222988.1 Cytochrome c oxidase assembly protein CtaG/Cox11, putative [Angomonas deanei]|eukprot:EPY26421.1 cytochrome c oxidase assembly protein subunit 11 [Angomonas deanei]